MNLEALLASVGNPDLWEAIIRELGKVKDHLAHCGRLVEEHGIVDDSDDEDPTAETRADEQLASTYTVSFPDPTLPA